MTSTSTNEPLYKINHSHHFYVLVSCLSHLEKKTHNIKAKLRPDQLALFRKTKFWHFLDLNIVFNGPLIDYLLLREVEDEGKDHISFLLGGVVCTFDKREFNIITGLWGPKEESIYVSDLDDIFLEYDGDDDDIVWAYESIPTIIGCGADKVNDDVIPRMLRWVCQQSPKSQTISQVFDSPMLIIKAVIEMTPKEEQLKIASGELFENLRSSIMVQSKNGGSKRGREVVNDEGDFKKSKKQKSKSKMKKAIQNLQDQVAVVEGQLTSIKSDIDELKGMMSTILKHIGLQRNGDEGDQKGFEGLVNHTLESEEVDNAKTEDVNTGGTPTWLRMPKEDDTSNGVKHIELKKKVEIGLEEPIDVVDDEHLDALFLFIRFKIKAVGIPSAQNFTTADTIFMHILVAKWPQYKESIKENRPFDWKEEYRLVDYVVGSKEDFQDPWASVDYVYSPFNVHANHWVLLCLDLVSCQVKVWDSLSSLTTAKEMRNILLPIRELVPNLLDSTGFFARRGGSSTYKEPWPVVIVDSIPLQRNNSDCGTFTIKYFEYIAVGVDLDTLSQENMSYFIKQLAFQLWTNTPMY
ncbi:hypothetical protein IC582_024142 [Cucumis melo]